MPLLAQAKNILTHHLTGLCRKAQTDVNLQPLINTIVAGQQLCQKEQAVAWLKKKAKESTTVSTCGEALTRLLKYCGVTNEHFCPNLGHIGKGPGQRPSYDPGR